MTSTITAAWEYFDPESTTQTGVRIRIEDANNSPLWSTSIATNGTEYPIPYTLADQAMYVLVVSSRDSSGMWSFEATQQFYVSYAKPPIPEIGAMWDLDLGGVVVSIEHPAPGEGEVDAISCDLQRSASGDQWETIATGLDPSTSAVDFIPTLDTINHYRVISYSDLPSSVESAPHPVMVESKGWVFVNGGPDWSYICRIRDNVSTTHAPARARVQNHFAGRRYPVTTAGEARSRPITVDGRTSGGGSTADEWENLLLEVEGVLMFREPGPSYGGAGKKLPVVLTDYQRSRERIFETVSLSFEQVEEV